MKSNNDMKYWPQISGAIIVSLVWLSLGALVGFPTIALPSLQANITTTHLQNNITNNSPNLTYYKYDLLSNKDETITIDPIYLDNEMGSWFAASFWLSSIPLTPLGGYLGGLLGRRKIILITHPGALIGWVILATSQNITTLFLGRFLSSISIAVHVSAVGVYIAESAHPKIRNNLTILPSILMSFGIWFVWTLGYFVSWRTTAFLCTIPNIIVILCLIPLPESPYWLVEAGKIDLAEKSLQFFRGPDYDISEEFEEIKEKRRSKVEMQGEKQSWNWTFKQLMSSSFLKPYSCVGVLYILCDWSGFSAFSTYMVQILKESGLSIDPRIGPITIGSIRLFFAGIIPFIVGKVKPKIMFVICQSISVLSIIAICVYSFLKEYDGEKEELEKFSWIPLVFIGTLIITRGVGIMPVLHILMNEMFPTDIRTLSIGITQSLFLLSGCVSIKMFPTFLDLIGMGGTCLLYALASGLCLIWGAITIPDNRGKSLVKVENNTTKKQLR